MTEQSIFGEDAFAAGKDGVMLPGPAGTIEAITALPDAEHEPRRKGVAIICHPHPQHAGTMHNKVVTMIERALRELGLATLRFNFRGVGASTGEYNDGKGEADDLAAMVDWVRQTLPGNELWLAGFSFGSYVSLSCAVRCAADAVITVAPPVGRWDFASLELPQCPWLVVQGEDDELVDSNLVFGWLDELAEAPQVVRMPETGHYFHRRLIDLRGVIKNAMRPHLPAEQQPA